MQCPACTNELSTVPAGEVIVNVCLGGCGGIWFDQFELQKLGTADESAIDLLVAVNDATQNELRIGPTPKRPCPRCQDIAMMRHFFSAQRRVEVDECPNCGGYWLDAGELALVREECETELECQRAVEKYFTETAGQALQQMRAGNPEQLKRAHAIDRLLRFSRPIRYQRLGE